MSILDHTDLLFPMSTSDVYSAIEELVDEWQLLGLNLNIPRPKIISIDSDFHHVEEKKVELIQTWMTDKNMPSWSLLVEALLSQSVDQPRIADKISQQRSKFCNPFPRLKTQ